VKSADREVNQTRNKYVWECRMKCPIFT
jgi:hypothetical protein